jgi:hypothetical protein
MTDPSELTVRRSIDELVVPGKRLGRHLEHDPASRAFPATRAESRVSTIHARALGPFNQGDVGSCTGNALGGLLMTAPFAVDGRGLDEQACLEFYSYATHLEGDVRYPEDGDPGSSGLAVAKAAHHAGYIDGYAHAFGLDHALDALVLTPVIIGVNWYEGFDTPDADAKVEISGDVRGGHEVELLAVNFEDSFVTGVNSWGPEYGHNGLFSFSFDTFGRLLDEDGDVTVITARAA